MPAAATLVDVLSRFPEEVRRRYDFSAAIYTGALKPITGITCPEHGAFQQYAAQLRRSDGSHCPKCGDIVRRAKQRTPAENMLARFRETHGETYDYSETRYFNYQTKITVRCRDHGPFDILPGNHIKGQGCPVCGAAKRGHRQDVAGAARATADTKLAQAREVFVADARKIHGDAYDYGETEYRGRRQEISVRCPKHGVFTQIADKHLNRGQGCPECSHHKSRGEAEILEYVNTLTTAHSRNRKVIAPKELDIYAPEHGLAVEYCGEYWHGASCPEDEAFARRRHAEKHKACEAAGVRLLTVYASEWENRAPAIKHLIQAATGKLERRVGARECAIAPVGPVPAADFFECFHVQGGAGYGVAYGLYFKNELVACMRFTLGINDRGPQAQRAWTLSRYATSVSVPGGASRLFKAFVDEHRPALVKSFSDNRYFDGAMYPKLGFELEAEIEPDYQVWHQKLGLKAKAAWQRKALPARIKDLRSAESFDPDTDPRSERDMTFLLGAHRLYDCGKKRWVWRQ